jgi:hypothetical protein
MVQLAGDINHSRPPAGGGERDSLQSAAVKVLHLNGSRFLRHSVLIRVRDIIWFGSDRHRI